MIRELLDLDSWLSTDRNLNGTLPNARATLWEIMQEQGEACTFSSCDTRRYYMPDSISNARKAHFTSPNPQPDCQKKSGPSQQRRRGGWLWDYLQMLRQHTG